MKHGRLRRLAGTKEAATLDDNPLTDAAIEDALRGGLTLVLNSASGSVTPASADEAQAIFAAAGFDRAQVIVASPADIDAALDAAVGTAKVLAVLGGDGAIRSAAERCGPMAPFLLPLPGGTMNMLPKALYGDRSWHEALADTLAQPRTFQVSGGKASGRTFFVAALFGAPTRWADAREALRAGRIGAALAGAFTAARRSFSEPLDYQFGSVMAGSAEAVAVVCPMISKALDNDEPMLEAAAVDASSAAEALRLGFHALFDDWRADPAVRRAKVRTAVVEGHGAVPAILDGEKARLGRRVQLEFTPRAFTAIGPRTD
ncbi:MAG TPA: diacylglycerol kinase family protein [Caulobacteraceae bacterium]|nr:diacylglycerol kinase family protein [Caulobacteraceae bacterium]